MAELYLRLLVTAASVAVFVSGETYDHTKCFSSKKGEEYSGNIAQTSDGILCQRWDTNAPHGPSSSISDRDFPEASKSNAENYCRNPDNDGDTPWCYTTNPLIRWQSCDVPHCFGWVDSVEPRVVSERGSVRVTIRGRGFAKSQFSFGEDSHVGNRVWFVNDYDSYECEIFSEGSTEDMIQCYTPDGMLEDKYSVRLSIDGTDTPADIGICNGNSDSWWCSIYTRRHYSPFITSVVPRSGPSDGFITINGRFWTNLYGPNAATASNGRTEKILRVYVQGKPCELKDGDEFYGLGMWNDYDGYIRCKLTSLNVPDNVNVSVIIDAPFGKTYAKGSALHLSAESKIFMYQSYAVIESISPSVGSTSGGQLLTIAGRNFDDTTLPNVMVGNEKCDVESVTATEILCRTPAAHAEPETSYPGNRGLWNDYFNASRLPFDKLTELETSNNHFSTFWSDGAYWCEGSGDNYKCQIKQDDNYNVRTRGYFMPRISGKYRYYIKCDDDAVLYLSPNSSVEHKEKILECPSYTRGSYLHSSEIFDYEAGKAYYIEYLAGEGYSGAHTYIGAKLYNPSLVQRIEDKVKPEEHEIKISSTVDEEELRITLDGLSTRIATHEVQTVEMTFTDEDGKWQLGVHGVYTDILTVDTSDIDLEKALNDLPTIYPEKVSVISNGITNGRQFTVTFESDLGNWPTMTKKKSGGATVTVSDATDGTASLNKWRLHLEHAGSDLISDLVSTLAPSGDLMQETVESIFSARCPRSIGYSAAYKKFYESYDNDHDTESEPFCGRGSAKNPGKLFDATNAIEFTTGGHICFAYRGLFRNFLRIRIQWASGTANYYPEFVFSNSTDGMEWFYTCIDLLSYAKQYRPNEGWYKLKEFEVYRELYDDIWVDEVVIAALPTTMNLETVVTDRRIPLTGRIRSVEVTQNDTAGYYDIIITPENCLTNLQMVRVFQAPKLSGSTTSSSTSVTWGDAAGTDWPSGASIKVKRLSKASPPVTGSWDLTYDSITKPFNANVSPTKLQHTLALEYGLSDVKVSREGTCHGYTFNLEFTRFRVDFPELTVDGTGLEGSNVDLTSTVEAAWIFYDPIPGDMLATREISPQVRVTINDISSRCNGNCSYGWSSDSTPTVDGVSPDTGSYEEVLTITGTNFSTTASENMVMIGEAVCTVNASTAVQITCTLGKGILGTFEVKVTVAALGSASGSVDFTVDAGYIDSVEPASGSVAGGTGITVMGYGFDDTAAVFVNDVECVLIGVTYTKLECITPASVETNPISVSVKVNNGATTLEKATGYTYDPLLTPKVTSFEPLSPSAVGGQQLVINGEGFKGYDNLTVYLFDPAGMMIELDLIETGTNDTTVTAMLPSLAPRDYTMVVFVNGSGYSSFDVSSVVTVTLRIEAISTHQGSFEGGTRLVIAGEGFGTDEDDVKVMIDSVDCDIEMVANDEITCYTGKGSLTDTVGNSGIHPVFGLGYAWDPQIAEIMAGDRIRFQWTSPPFVTSNYFKVMQTPTADAEHDGTGFTSGEGSNNGDFTNQFNEPGTYYYTTGLMGPLKNLEMRGKIIVTEKTAYTANVSVSVGGQLAENDPNSGVSISETIGCAGTTDPMDSCTETDPLSGAKFEFAYMKCVTPEVSSQDVTQGYIDTDITIEGKGFSTTACDNEVMIGEYTCVPSSQTDSQIVCAMDATENPDVGIKFDLMVRVNNRGNALLPVEKNTFALLPSISAISPTTGSLNGGLNLTISGAGFVGDASVMIGLAPCNIISQSYTEIVCATTASGNAANVTVTVTNSVGMTLPAECVNNNCEFAYEAASTPTLVAIVTPEGNIETPGIDIVFNGTSLGTDINDIMVMVGDYLCEVTAVSDTQVECTLEAVPAGKYDITVNVAGMGVGNGLQIVAALVIDAIVPSSGSVWGGQEVTVSGVGFREESTTITINSVDCEVTLVSTTSVKCMTGASDSLDNAIVVVDIDYKSPDATLTYNYSSVITPAVTGLDVTSGVAGEEIVIAGTGFSSTDSSVMIGGAECAVTAASTTEITCTVASNVPGVAYIVVNIDGVGYSNGDTEFTYLLSTGSISPIQGSFGGGQTVVLGGTGFSDGVDIVLCGMVCRAVDITATTITFITPSMEQFFGDSDKECDLTVTINQENSTILSAFTYTASDTPVISALSPSRGGTQGGTKVTIAGENFSASDNMVSIDGAECGIESQSANEIVCVTGVPGRTIKSIVMVKAGEIGISLKDNSEFWYVDVWSSKFTWGGSAPPTEGDFVVVKQGQTLLLDEDTKVLKMLLIQGGELLFDDVDLILRAENILIVNGGRLTVGTEEKPFQYDATIEMHGQLRSQELPIYGAKCLAVREGELNLHGKPLRMTWTRLAETAVQGANEIKLQWGQADWPIGGTIAIATTGDRHSQKETEIHTIKSISEDGQTIVLNETLEFEHLGVTEELGGEYTLEMRAEVAVLSRNVRVIGSRDIQWSDEIEACPDGFDTGEFATQTCFQGRFGDEIGSDQFGAQIMLHAPFPNEQLVVAKLSYIEVNYAGQAFRLGRYPVHFHLNGDMTGSYVRGLSIHETFNRAVNIHGTHNVLVEHTVIYNVMGGAFFLEDGIETGNKYYYNLALFVKASSSLLNDDITPAAFWATNPDNIYEHNAVAGGTHFGWWYRLLEHPEGPSATNTICPRKVPLGTCNNNTVHSNGWFGLWTFQDYYPVVGGGCSSTEPEPAVFNAFTVWNCEKGLEFVNGGSLQFTNCLLANNKLTGVEGKKNLNLGSEAPYSDRGPMIKDTVIAAYVPNHPQNSGGQRLGVVLPWSEGFSIINTTFINYDSKEEVALGMTTIQGTCSELCGGYNYHFSGVKFINGDDHIGLFRWAYDGVFVDKDGSLTGEEGAKVLPWTDTLDPSKCRKDPRFSHGAAEGAVCDSSTSFSRMSFNNPNIDAMKFKNVHMVNEFGSQIVEYADKRMTHPQGWTAVVELGQTYKMVWENIEHIVNISYNVEFSDLQSGGVVIKHNVSSKPDQVQTSGNLRDISESSPTTLTYEQNIYGDFFYDEMKKEISYLVSGKTSRTKRAAENVFIRKSLAPKAIRCYWPGCEAPPDQNTLPPVASRPPEWVWWSNNTIWPDQQLPTEDSEVTIDAGMWVVADINFPRLHTLVLEGNLEFDFEKIPDTDDYRNFTLEVKFLIIRGGRLVVGWEENRFLGNAEIVLDGDTSTPAYPQSSGANIGQKVIAVYGGLDLHGRQRLPVQTTLAATAEAGDTFITVSDDVDWKVKEEIFVTSTSFDTWQTEILTITAVNGRELTVSPALAHRHIGASITDSTGKVYSLSAEVALLTRNIVVRGGDHTNMERLGFGGRILVSSTTKEDGSKLTGWARISYTQFKKMGQYGYTNGFDPRYALAYVGTGEVTSVKPSYMKGNAFNHGYSPAIGFFGASYIKAQDNIIHRVVGGGMVVYGDGHVIERNLISLNIWPGTYNGRKELKNVAYDASYELVKAGDIIFRDNVAAGSERAGFRVAGQMCVTVEDVKWQRNKAHSGLFGVMMWEKDEISTTCFKITGFTAWKNFDFGIFIQTPSDRIELEDNNLIENGLGMWTHTFGPGSLSHDRKEKSVLFKRGYVSGATDSFDCQYDVMPDNDNMALSGLARSWRIEGGLVGISMPNADGGANGLPTHPFKGRMSYPTLDAKMDIEDTTFANFKSRQCNGAEVNDFVISTNPTADDINHPAYISGATVEDTVSPVNKAFFHRSVARSVNPSDCVDMDCDGHKKSLLYDLDGSFIGKPGTVVDDAAYEWDGDARYGLGDYRIPKVMLTFPNSTRFDPPKQKGIFRDGCTYIEEWQAFKCFGPQYRMIVIESMDADTEVRRLSPIGVKARTSSGGFIDLLNGPQDHGWCAGYTCQKRISTFWTVVADGVTFDIYLTGTNPQHTRFFMLQAENTESVRLAVYYFSPQRLDVFSDNVYIYPTNAEVTEDGNYNLVASKQTPSEHLPSLDAASGHNYFDREWQLQYLVLRSTSVVDVIIKQVVIVSLSLPPMTIDEFFGKEIINNLATFLGVPANKIRIVDIVSESSGRRKRADAGTVVSFEIGDAPSEDSNVTQVNDGALDRTTLLNLTRKVVDSVQLGTLGSSLNLTILGIDVQEPLPEPENSTSSSWAALSTNSSEILAYIQIPSTMMYATELVADREQQPFPTQPQFAMYDSSGDLVAILGSRENPWKIRATLKADSGSNPNAMLVGDTDCGFKDGICAFLNLGISHSGTGFIIEFEVFDPDSAPYSAMSSSISIREAELSAGFTDVPNKDSPVQIDEEFTVVVDIRDLSSQMRVEDIGWKGDSWTASVSIYDPDISPPTTLSGTLQQQFNSDTGFATFNDLSLSTRGRYALKVTVTSGEQNLHGRSTVLEVTTSGTSMQSEDVSYKFILRVLEDYEVYAEDNEDLVEASVYNYLQTVDETARYHDFVVSQGSIYVEFWASGETAPLMAIIDQVEEDIAGSISLTLPGGVIKFDPYMMLDDAVYGGLVGTDGDDDDDDDDGADENDMDTTTVEEVKKKLTPIIIVILVAALLVVVSVVILIVVIIKKKNAKTAQGDEEYAGRVTTSRQSSAWAHNGDSQRQSSACVHNGDSQQQA